MNYDGDWGSDAIAVNNRIIELDKYYINSYLRLAKCYARRNNYNERYNTYIKLLEIDNSNEEAKRYVKIHIDRMSNIDAVTQVSNISSNNIVNEKGYNSTSDISKTHTNINFLSRNSQDTSEIKEYMLHRNITKAYHFTHISNLDNIYRNNIMPIKELHMNGISVMATDPDRLEGHTDSICLSLSHPNTLMMWNKIYNLGYKFAILELDPKVIYGTENVIKYFYPSNAVRFRNNIQKNYTGIKSLKSLFGGNEIRWHNQIDEFYTTDPQAEILYEGVIDKKHIRNIYIRKQDKFYINNIKNDFVKAKIILSDQYFNNRKDSDYWR